MSDELQPASAPLISVIIPFFASHGLLPACLASIAAHMSLPYEIILVDDGNIEFDFSEMEQTPYLTLVRLPRNRGLSAARNEGFKVASGKWVLWLDSDDLLIADPAAYVTEANSADTPEADIILGRLDGLQLAPAFAGRTPFATTFRDELKLAKTGTFSAHLYRADHLRTHGISFPEGVSAAEDLVFLMRVFAASNKLVVSDVAVYRVTERPGSLSRQGLSFESYRMRFGRAAPMVIEALAEFPEHRAVRLSMVFKYALQGLQKRLDALSEDQKHEAFQMLRHIVLEADLTSYMAAAARTTANVKWDESLEAGALTLASNNQHRFFAGAV